MGEASRIKLKVWDQQSANNKIGKKEKTEFIAKIAEQISRNVVSSEEEFDEMPSNHDPIIQEDLTVTVIEEPNGNNNNDGDHAPDQEMVDDEKKEEEEEDRDEEEQDKENDDQNEEYKYNLNGNGHKSPL